MQSIIYNYKPTNFRISNYKTEATSYVLKNSRIFNFIIVCNIKLPLFYV